MVNGRIAGRVVDQLHVEAMLLADEARSYFDGAGRSERDLLPAADRVGFACESLRVTTRLMHVVAWLLTQRAVACGEIAPSDAAMAERRLGAMQESDPDLAARLPDEARRLIAATIGLHRRIARLDETLGDPPAPNPVGGLLARIEGAF